MSGRSEELFRFSEEGTSGQLSTPRCVLEMASGFCLNVMKSKSLMEIDVFFIHNLQLYIEVFYFFTIAIII